MSLEITVTVDIDDYTHPDADNEYVNKILKCFREGTDAGEVTLLGKSSPLIPLQLAIGRRGIKGTKITLLGTLV